MSKVVTLPIEYGRTFSLHLYWASHGPLLLRSFKNDKHPTRIDILFGDVRWMSLPVWLEGIRLERGELSETPLPLTKKIKEEAHLMCLYKVVSQGVTNYVLAGKNVLVSEDKGSFGENSSLLPHLDFRGLVAPLWKDEK